MALKAEILAFHRIEKVHRNGAAITIKEEYLSAKQLEWTSIFQVFSTNAEDISSDIDLNILPVDHTCNAPSGIDKISAGSQHLLTPMTSPNTRIEKRNGLKRSTDQILCNTVKGTLANHDRTINIEIVNYVIHPFKQWTAVPLLHATLKKSVTFIFTEVLLFIVSGAPVIETTGIAIFDLLHANMSQHEDIAIADDGCRNAINNNKALCPFDARTKFRNLFLIKEFFYLAGTHHTIDTVISNEFVKFRLNHRLRQLCLVSIDPQVGIQLGNKLIIQFFSSTP